MHPIIRRTSPSRLEHAALALSFLVVVPLASAQLVTQDVEYDCQIIASTDQFPEGLDAPPTINASGRVAFRVSGAQGRAEVRSGRGDTDMSGAPISVAVARAGPATEPDTDFSSIDFDVVIDDQNRIYWHGSPQGSSAVGLFRKQFDTPLSLPAETMVTNQFGDPTSPIVVLRPGFSVNSQGQMIFRARRVGQPSDELLTGTDALLATPLAVNGQNGAIHPGVQPWTAHTVSNASTTDLYLDSTVPLVSVDATSRGLSGLSVNGTGMPFVSFIESIFDVPGTTFRLRLESPIASDTLVDDGIDTITTFTRPDWTSTNGFGEVIFNSFFGSGEALFWADGDALQRVVCRDQFATFGVLSFFRTQISSHAINNDGEFAFRAETGFLVPSTLADEAFILKASPLSTAHPLLCTGLPDGVPCDDEDPATVAFCSSGTCQAVPEPGFGLAVVGGVLAVLRFANGVRKSSRRSSCSIVHTATAMPRGAEHSRDTDDAHDAGLLPKPATE